MTLTKQMNCPNYGDENEQNTGLIGWRCTTGSLE